MTVSRDVSAGARIGAALGRAAVLAVMASLALATPSRAEDAAPLCGAPGGAPEAIEARLKESNVPEVFRDKEFVAYQDKATMTLWTFTLPAHAAHPTVVCRRPVEKDQAITLQMDITCKAAEKACFEVTQAFKELNLQMQTAIENGEGKTP